MCGNEQTGWVVLGVPVTATCGYSSALIDIWVLWATVEIKTIGTTPPNAVQFNMLYDMTEFLGARSFNGGNTAVGKVVPILESDIDEKGRAYEEIVGANLRGDRGEFFTPRNTCRLAVEMLDPGEKQLLLDPACGTGGFLITAMNHVIAKIREA